MAAGCGAVRAAISSLSGRFREMGSRVDYVVFGIGLGATLVLVGWALRTFGPVLRHRAKSADGLMSAAAMVEKLSWSRFVSALGAVVTSGGALMLLATVAAIALTPSDRLGTIIVLSAFLVVLILACAWAWVYIGRYGTHGILPARTVMTDTANEPDEMTAVAVVGAPDTEPESAVVPAEAEDGAAEPAEPPTQESVESPMAEAAVDEDAEAPDATAEPEVAPQPGEPAESEAAPEATTPVSEAGSEPESGTARSEPDSVPAESTSEANESPSTSEADASSSTVEVEEPVSADEADEPGDAGDPAGKEHFVDVLPRTSLTAEASGRAEALRRLRQRRAARFAPEQE